MVVLYWLLTSCTNYSDPNSVALAYIKAVYDGNVESFKQLVEKKHYSTTLDYKYFTNKKSDGKLKSADLRGGIKEISMIGNNTSKPHSYIKFKVIFQDNTRKQLEISLHLKGNRWFVDPMSWESW